VLLPASTRLLPADADPRLDIANELYGWRTALDAVRAQMRAAAAPFDPEGREVVVVGPHWTVCAQLHAGLPGIRVGCAGPTTDDFDTWLPREQWRAAENVLFVTDNRFGGDGAEQLPAHVPIGQSRVVVYRGGRVARTFELFLYGQRASGFQPFGPSAAPTARTSGFRGTEVRDALAERVEQEQADDHVDRAPGVGARR
jgi:hypothetical protein